MPHGGSIPATAGRSFARVMGVVIVLILWLAPAIVFARAGGGEGYHGGGGGGGGGGGHGGGGGGAVYLVYLLIRLCFQYPIIGIPLLILVIYFMYNAGQSGTTAYQSSIVRRGNDLIDQREKSAVIDSIRQHDPQFNEEAFCQRVANAFNKIQEAWAAQDLHSVRPFISDGVYERFSLQFAEQRDAGYRNVLENIRIHDVRVADVSATGLFDEISVRITAEAADFRVWLSNGKQIGGSRAADSFVEVWSFLRRRGAVTQQSRAGLMEGNCPNCGAPIELNESANCANCKALLRSGEYDWVLSEITQASEWQSGSGLRVAGLDELRKQDEDFDPLALEDRASVVFWRRAAVDRTGKIDPLRKVATDELCAKYALSLRQPAQEPRTFIGECAVGAVHMLGFLPAEGAGLERAVVEVRWSGTRFAKAPNQPPVRAGDDFVGRTLFIFGRKPDSRTDAGKSISSAHCPNCGAPESGGTSNACEYCSTVLNDGSHGWVLLDMPPFSSPDAQNLLDQLDRSAADSARQNSAAGTDAGLLAWATKVAAADGNIDPTELELLTSFAETCGVSSEQFGRFINAASRGQLEVPEPADRDEAQRWIMAMAQTAQADGNISAPELSLLRTLGAKMGLGDYDVQMLVRQARSQQYAAASAALRTARNQPRYN